MKQKITFKGNPCTLVGRPPKEDKIVSDFRVVSKDLSPVGLNQYESFIKVLTTFPSLDTGVCESQLKEFNHRAAELSRDTVILAISRDLPFAQKRFCAAEGIDHVIVLSDYRFSSFGINYGVLIKELNLLARAVFIVDKNNVMRYVQIVSEVSHPPDYDDVFQNLENVINNPSKRIPAEGQRNCKPCEGGIAAMSEGQALLKTEQMDEWNLIDGKKIFKTFRFKDFVEAKYFVDLIAEIAEGQQHHPDIRLNYNKVDITLTTHAAKGLTTNDFIMAQLIDELNTG